ncbi:hypothetical protein [Salinibacter altiplanensis]|uniref:hypothetical protein n=1 Tax=Salinibacter altiplanensis TaxID=1803181 RepID=UPI000C9F42CD|nr:hypothetical protein [Salinibacter altiplanensis]
MSIRVHHVASDLVPDSGLAKLVVPAIAGFSAAINWEPIGLVAVIFLLNVLATAWAHSRLGGRKPKEIAISTVNRALGYLFVVPSVLIFSKVIGDVEFVRRFIVSAVGGIELVYTVALVARVIPRIRPLYIGIVSWVDNNTPLSMESEEVDRIISEQQQDESE